MIKLVKGPTPKILADNVVAWTTELLGYISRNEKIPSSVADRYNQSEVKEALRQETHGLCMYCESVIAHVSYAHIEHIKPKAKTKYPELSFVWDNLGLACPVCNMNKADTYEDSMPLLNPYIDDPEEFLIAYGVFIIHRPGQGFLIKPYAWS